jgi:hypothetical protein
VLLDELDGLDDVLVAGAAAEVAFEALPDLLLRRVGFSFRRLMEAMIMPGVQYRTAARAPRGRPAA